MIRSAPLLLIALIAIAMVSCQPGEATNNKPVVSVSILPQKYFIERLAGEYVEVNVLIPPGASPATYEPTLTQLTKLDQSNVYMRIGYIGFELSWMDRILSVNPDMKIVDLSSGITMIHEEGNHGEDHHGHGHGGVDPHIWMSAINAKTIVYNIYKELILMLPKQKDSLKIRYLALEQELDSLHLLLTYSLQELKQKSFLIYHPALTYFARDYGLKQYPLEIEGKTPSPTHLKKIIDLGRKENINSIFIQSQFDQRNAEVLADEIDAKIIPYNPLDEQWDKQKLYIAKQFTSL
jgi:zinc transport system substrate-binding protein